MNVSETIYYYYYLLPVNRKFIDSGGGGAGDDDSGFNLQIVEFSANHLKRYGELSI